VNLKILVACEESQTVAIALRDKGVEEYSCDLLPPSGGRPEIHLQQDVIPILHDDWDAIFAFPPCNNLSVSGARYFKEKRADGRQQQSIEFFLQFTRFTVPFAIENPVGVMSTYYRKPDQIINPWQFGHGEKKRTCLWLNKLPLLVPTNVVDGRKERIYLMGPIKDRQKLRSKTYQGIADAMADQWVPVLWRRKYGFTP
jgi:hypothetical protein